MFLEEREPYLIDRILERIRYGNYNLIKKVFEDELRGLEKDFSDWLTYKSAKINSFDFYNSIYNSIEEEVIYTPESGYGFSIEQNQSDYSNNVKVEYYI